MELGSIILWKNIKTFGSRLQRWWTYTIYSHTGIFAGSSECGNLEFEADLKVRFHIYKDSYKEKCDIIKIKASDEVRKEALQYVVDTFENEMYGAISWFTIFLRFLFQRIGFKNTRQWNILWGWGVHCSELTWYYLRRIEKNMDWDIELDEYNPDIFVPQDLRNIINKFPEYFEVKQ